MGYDNTPEEFRLRALRYFRRRANKHDAAEDFASWAVLKFLEGRKATIRQLFIDYTRQNLWDSRRPGNKGVQVRDFDVERLPAPIGSDLIFSAATLQGQDRAVVYLTYKWGFEPYEIAECFGVTSSRVIQLLDRARETIAKRIRNEVG